MRGACDERRTNALLRLRERDASAERAAPNVRFAQAVGERFLLSECRVLFSPSPPPAHTCVPSQLAVMKAECMRGRVIEGSIIGVEVVESLDRLAQLGFSAGPNDPTQLYPNSPMPAGLRQRPSTLAAISAQTPQTSGVVKTGEVYEDVYVKPKVERSLCEKVMGWLFDV